MAYKDKVKAKEHYKEYYRTHKSVYIEKAKLWREKNPDKVKKSRRRWRDNNKEKCLRYWREYRIRHREQIKQTRKERDRRYYRNNKEKCRACSREWYFANRERSMASCREWAKKNPLKKKEINARRRSRQKGEIIDLTAVIKSQEGKCFYCRTALTAKCHVDHLIPLSRGGAHSRKNVGMTCPKCNLVKHTATAIEYCEKKNIAPLIPLGTDGMLLCC